MALNMFAYTNCLLQVVFRIEEGLGLPKPTENFILAGDRKITYSDLQIPSTKELKIAFASLLGVITSRDTRSTRREDQLNQNV